MHAAFIEGIERFNHRDFHASHEALETVWRQAEPAFRPLYQGLIQLAAAYLKIERRQYDPAVRLFKNALKNLSTERRELDGLALSDVIAVAQGGLAKVETLGPERLGEFEPGWYPKLRLTGDLLADPT